MKPRIERPKTSECRVYGTGEFDDLRLAAADPGMRSGLPALGGERRLVGKCALLVAIATISRRQRSAAETTHGCARVECGQLSLGEASPAVSVQTKCACDCDGMLVKASLRACPCRGNVIRKAEVRTPRRVARQDPCKAFCPKRAVDSTNGNLVQFASVKRAADPQPRYRRAWIPGRLECAPRLGTSTRQLGRGTLYDAKEPRIQTAVIPQGLVGLSASTACPARFDVPGACRFAGSSQLIRHSWQDRLRIIGLKVARHQIEIAGEAIGAKVHRGPMARQETLFRRAHRSAA